MMSDEFFTKLDAQIQSGNPFVAYRNPKAKNGLTKALLQDSAEIYKTSNFTENGFIFSPFKNAENTFLIPSENAEIITAEYPAENLEGVKKENTAFPPAYTNNEAKIKHEKLVQKGIEVIEEGELKKVVLSRKEDVQTQLNALDIFKNLLKKYETAFVYFWFHPQTGIWLGATPETLLNVERDKFKTMALAGTQAFKGTSSVNWGEKEIEEQQIVTDSILENLEHKVSGTIHKSEPYTSKAGNLLHLQTDITGMLNLEKKTSLKSLILALHPTPAVCGLPKKMAQQFILENEDYDREFYSGFLGELNMKKEVKRNNNRRNQENQAYGSILKQTSLFVNLRCMKLEAGKARLFIGGGITKDSNPADEWQETVNKSHTIKSVLVK
ncbi:chorismate-binding protein [Salegentibacter salegens]|uniref:Isochorismate synthase n=1 Tax=Salegentibacter salegens TaxID=143223 RepID=A0A1M7H7Z6_9FLAO|nr:chorismate-binding protein [Salegentibacter salegens]PRX40522.1 isochorismate synthase [Salegentibacter salegens]SHM24590.1 isochorismate synthase [Salegentibacter salegens]SHN10133.1 isochorismate synthase [Salegentibacter salegens]